MIEKKRIKVLHLGYSDNYGGASVAMNKINEALSLIDGIDSKIAVVTHTENSKNICLSTSLWDKIWLYIRVRLAYKSVLFLQRTSNHSGRSINFFPSTVSSRIANFEFDILHLHWIGNETIRLEDLMKITKPIVWTFHDTWPLLGAEHTDINNSIRFVEGYSEINRPKTTRGLDIDRWTWKRKKNIFSKVNIHPVVVSSWLAEETKKSLLWKNSNPKIIHNPIKIDSWELKNKMECKAILDIPPKNKVVVFGAINGLTDELKGYLNLEKAILLVGKSLEDKQFTLLVFGDPDVKKIKLSNNVELVSVGKINDLKLINTIYCSADLVVVPSYLETFGQVAVESISCGVPVVAFRTSGLLDIIIENFNGLLSKPFCAEDMAEKILSALSLKWDSVAMRNDVENRFGYIQIAKKHELFYKKIMQ
jgi:glycosyltransferase involved in cell wall biosynthesis